MLRYTNNNLLSKFLESTVFVKYSLKICLIHLDFLLVRDLFFISARLRFSWFQPIGISLHARTNLEMIFKR